MVNTWISGPPCDCRLFTHPEDMRPERQPQGRRRAQQLFLGRVPAPDAEERLRRAYELILRAAGRTEEQGTAQEDCPDGNEFERGQD